VRLLFNFSDLFLQCIPFLTAYVKKVKPLTKPLCIVTLLLQRGFPFQDSSNEERDLLQWYFSECLPAVCKPWNNKTVQASQSFNQVVKKSDEALVFFFLFKHASEWSVEDYGQEVVDKVAQENIEELEGFKEHMMEREKALEEGKKKVQDKALNSSKEDEGLDDRNKWIPEDCQETVDEIVANLLKVSSKRIDSTKGVIGFTKLSKLVKQVRDSPFAFEYMEIYQRNIILQIRQQDQEASDKRDSTESSSSRKRKIKDADLDELMDDL
jgi:hypothetical protein